MGIKISELEEVTTANSNDVIPVVNAGNGGTKKIKKENLLKNYLQFTVLEEWEEEE